MGRRLGPGDDDAQRATSEPTTTRCASSRWSSTVPKTWSLAAALHPEVSAALDRAQHKAAIEIIGWVAAHATTRVGPRGRQVQVPVESIEAAVIRHYTSRAGDPHRHLHLQINARVWTAGAWRCPPVGVRDSIEAINGIGHAAVATDPEFRAVLAAHGLTVDPETSEIRELAPYVGAFSARAQIRCNVDRLEADWRCGHPDQEPGPRMREVGPAGGRRHDPTRSCPGRSRARRPMERRAPRGWLPRPGPRCPLRRTLPGGGSTATLPLIWSSRCSAPGGRPGTRLTSAGRPRSCSPRRRSSRTPPPGSSWRRTSLPGPSRAARRC